MPTPFSKRILLSSLVLVAAGASAVVSAGVHYTSEVAIKYDPTRTIVLGATGALFAAHDSSDSHQLIGCGGSVPPMWCQAHDASPDTPGALNQAFCTTSNPELVAQIRSISPQSYINFTLNPATGECTSIYVAQSSGHLRH